MAIARITWTKSFTEREVKEIDFARIYTDSFSHGTDGHNAKVIISKMSNMLNYIHNAMTNPLSSDADKIEKIDSIMNPKNVKVAD